jgi:hypothetical protein
VFVVNPAGRLFGIALLGALTIFFSILLAVANTATVRSYKFYLQMQDSESEFVAGSKSILFLNFKKYLENCEVLFRHVSIATNFIFCLCDS